MLIRVSGGYCPSTGGQSNTAAAASPALCGPQLGDQSLPDGWLLVHAKHRGDQTHRSGPQKQEELFNLHRIRQSQGFSSALGASPNAILLPRRGSSPSRSGGGPQTG